MVVLLASSAVSAQTALSLKDAISYALKNKSEAVNARLDLQNSEFQIEEVRANALPQISANGGITYNALLQQMALNFGGQTQVIRMGQPWQSTSTLQLNQQLFNMSVFQGLKAAKSTRDFYAINAELTEEQVIEKVVNSYYDVYRTKAQLTTIESTINNTTRVKDVISSLVENGLAKKIDLDRTNVALNNLNSSKTQLVSAVQMYENVLKYLIGMDITSAITLEETTFEAPAGLLMKEEFNPSELTQIRLLEKQGELLHLDKKVSEAAYYPTLSLSANYGYLTMGDRFPYFADGHSSVSGSDFSAITLNLSIPIFNGFSTRAKTGQKQVAIIKHEADLKDTKLAVNLNIENAYTQINNSVSTLSSQKSNMELAKEVLQDVENNYQNGLSTLTDLMDAETSYADAQNNYTNALLDYKLAEVQLIKAKGQLKSYFAQSNQ